jgi:predicted nucleotidyltransferase
MNPRPKVLDDLVAKLAEQRTVQRVVLFGSRARGDGDERADVDLAVEAPDADAREWDAILALVEAADTLLEIDLVRLDTASTELRQRVQREGEVLHER